MDSLILHTRCGLFCYGTIQEFSISQPTCARFSSLPIALLNLAVTSLTIVTLSVHALACVIINLVKAVFGPYRQKCLTEAGLSALICVLSPLALLTASCLFISDLFATAISPEKYLIEKFNICNQAENYLRRL